MGFVKRLIRALSLFSIAGMVVATNPGFSQTSRQGKAPAPTPATERGPSSADLVNKALNPGASDPDVPLPHPDLANSGADRPASASKPQIFGRQEQGGGVFGFRMPIPADRSSTGRSN
jgi:hypothetical protein